MHWLTRIVIHLDMLAPLLALLVYFWKKPKGQQGMRVVLYFLLAQLILNGLSNWFEFKRLSNYFLYSINSLVSFGLLLWLFAGLLPVLGRKWWPLVAVVYLIIYVVAAYAGEGTSAFNSVQAASANFIITACCLFYFYHLFVAEPARLSVTDSPVFWSVVGLFTYYTGSFLIAISYKWLIQNNAGSIGLLWKFHNILLLVCCLYIAYGIIWKQTPKIPS